MKKLEPLKSLVKFTSEILTSEVNDFFWLFFASEFTSDFTSDFSLVITTSDLPLRLNIRQNYRCYDLHFSYILSRNGKKR